MYDFHKIRNDNNKNIFEHKEFKRDQKYPFNLFLDNPLRILNVKGVTAKEVNKVNKTSVFQIIRISPSISKRPPEIKTSTIRQFKAFKKISKIPPCLPSESFTIPWLQPQTKGWKWKSLWEVYLMWSLLKTKYIKKSMGLSMTPIMNVLTLKLTLRRLSVKSEEKYQKQETNKILKSSRLRRKLLQKKWLKMMCNPKGSFQIQQWQFYQHKSIYQKASMQLYQWTFVMTRNSFSIKRCTEQFAELFYLLNFLWYFVSFSIFNFFIQLT